MKEKNACASAGISHLLLVSCLGYAYTAAGFGGPDQLAERDLPAAAECFRLVMEYIELPSFLVSYQEGVFCLAIRSEIVYVFCWGYSAF